MPNKKNVNMVTIGKQSLPGNIQITVNGIPVTLTLYNGFYEKPLVELIEALNTAKLDPEVKAQKAQGLLKNSRYVALALPEKLQGSQFRLQGRIYTSPKWEIAHKLYSEIKKVNPSDMGREGNVNQLLLPENTPVSIGNYGYLTMGISQTRVSPNGGVSGGYSPHKLFEALIKGGYKALITSTSVQYLKCIALLEKQAIESKGKKKK